MPPTIHKTQIVPLSHIFLDCQVRAEINTETVADYQECMKAGDVFPPIVVFFDGEDYHLANGYHRYQAMMQTGMLETKCIVYDGGQKDALKYAFTANNTNGLRFTNADKRSCVRMAIENWPQTSDNSIAEMCGVTRGFVTKLKRDNGIKDNAFGVIGSDGKVYNKTRFKRPSIESLDVDDVEEQAEARKSLFPASSEHIQAGPDTTAKTVVRDVHGVAIPDALVELYGRRETLNVIADKVAGISRLISQKHEQGDPLFSGFNVDAIDIMIKNVINEIKFQIPYCVCPICSGNFNTEKCRCCHGRGVISKHTWDVTIPEEIKKLAKG